MESLILFQSPLPKIRLGKDNDGGYVICNMPDGYDMFVACGIAGDISFEKDFLNMYNVECYAFDGTVNGLPEDIKEINFIQKNIGNTNTDKLTNLHSYIENYENVFLKMDIEGHEYDVFDTFDSGLLKKFKQIVMEFHTPAEIRLYPEYFKDLSHINEVLTDTPIPFFPALPDLVVIMMTPLPAAEP